MALVRLSASAYRPLPVDEARAASRDRGPGDWPGRADPAMEAAEGRLMLRVLLVGLPIRDQRMLRMRFEADMSQRLIADAIGIS